MKKSIFKKWWFWVIIAVILIMTIPLDSDENQIELPQYDIYSQEDLSINGVIRYQYNVVVLEQVSVEQLKDIAHEVVEDAKQKNEFNAVVIGFYDYPEYVGYGFTLGKVTYAPECDWAKADTVTSGQYSNMDYDYELLSKNWDKQLTVDEIAIYSAWNKLYDEKAVLLVDGLEIVNEDIVDQEIADEFDITTEDINEIMLKSIVWAMNNCSE